LKFLLPRDLPKDVWQVHPTTGVSALNHNATEEPGVLEYDAVVLGGFRRCEGRGDFIFKGQDILKIKVVEDDN
jgi:hypothetical protein